MEDASQFLPTDQGAVPDMNFDPGDIPLSQASQSLCTDQGSSDSLDPLSCSALWAGTCTSCGDPSLPIRAPSTTHSHTSQS